MHVLEKLCAKKSNIIFKGFYSPERTEYERILYDSKGILRKDAGQRLDGVSDDQGGADPRGQIWAVLEDPVRCL